MQHPSIIVHELSELIKRYQLRLAKIEKARDRVSDLSNEKAFKESAAIQTKRFIADLKRLQKSAPKTTF